MTRALAACALLAATACGGLDEVDLTRSATATVPGIPGGEVLPSGTISALGIALGRNALDEEGIDPNDVDSARLVALRLDVTSGASLETWMEAISFHVEAPGLPRVLVAQRSGIRSLPAGTRSVDLEVTGVDLKPYVLEPVATITAEATGRPPAEDTVLRATATLRVDVNVSGLLD